MGPDTLSQTDHLAAAPASDLAGVSLRAGVGTPGPAQLTRPCRKPSLYGERQVLLARERVELTEGPG